MTPPSSVVATNPSHLRSLIKEAIKKHGPRCSLNHIDISRVQSLDHMFSGNSHFEGSVARWNTKNVLSMRGTFARAHFNGDLTQWNVANVQDMEGMFASSRFNKSLAKWNVRSVKKFNDMFSESRFSKDLSAWTLADNATTRSMLPHGFSGACPANLTAAQWTDLCPYSPTLMAHFEKSAPFHPGMTWWLYLAQAPRIPAAVPKNLHSWLERARTLGKELSMPHADLAMHMALSHPMNAQARATFDALVRREYVVRCAILGIMAPPQGQEEDSWMPGSTALARRRFEAILGAQHELIVPPEVYELPSLMR